MYLWQKLDGILDIVKLPLNLKSIVLLFKFSCKKIQYDSALPLF